MSKSRTKKPSPTRGPVPTAAARAVVDHGFIPVRAKLIEVAAFLDRAERHAIADDFRVAALRDAAELLVDGKPERARRILEQLSDPTTEPEAVSSGKAALGAWRPAAPATAKK
ncbi:MAG: hypothetical protein JNL39_20205 [Opitutaceae bacterium]|nr:hypothetical protein [Opitutaceae bacterium]